MLQVQPFRRASRWLLAVPFVRFLVICMSSSKFFSNAPVALRLREEGSVAANPCVACGACCATYRVSFYWQEAEANGLSAALTRQITPFHSCMAGTEAHPVRCVALAGTIGQQVSCQVYEQRTSPCREVQVGDERCNRARAHHGLHALEPVPAFLMECES